MNSFFTTPDMKEKICERGRQYNTKSTLRSRGRNKDRDRKSQRATGERRRRGRDKTRAAMWVIPASVRCVQTAACWDRQAGTGGQTGVSGHTHALSHHTPRARIPPLPHACTQWELSPASRTSGNSNVKYSNRDKGTAQEGCEGIVAARRGVRKGWRVENETWTRGSERSNLMESGALRVGVKTIRYSSREIRSEVMFSDTPCLDFSLHSVLQPGER